jgi:hypothetical protein
VIICFFYLKNRSRIGEVRDSNKRKIELIFGASSSTADEVNLIVKSGLKTTVY